MKTLIKRNPIRDQRGSSLIEVMLSIALLGILVVGFLSAIGTGSMALFTTDERQTAKNLAESQMEYVKRLPFDNSYEAADFGDEYAGYAAAIMVSGMGENLQAIEVIITRNGKEVLRLRNYKGIL